MPHSIRYCFNQYFSVPACYAYKWCTHYDSQDHILMHHDAERQIMQITEATIILTDIFHTKSGPVLKQKLIQLYPVWLLWTSTHLSGPNKHSQFIYKIAAESDNASNLDFTALHIEHEYLDDKSISLLSDTLKKEDSAAWKLLAKEMKKEFGKLPKTGYTDT